MKILVNGVSISTDQRTISGLLVEQGYQGLVVATALDQTFICIAQRDNTLLYEGCHVDIVAPMQGG